MAPARARRGRAVLALRGSGEQVCNGVEFDFCPVIFFYEIEVSLSAAVAASHGSLGKHATLSTLETPAGHSEVTVHKGVRAPSPTMGA
jgi:hypothetical protein